MSERHPVELLHDGRGVYGIGSIDFKREIKLILRRDRVADGESIPHWSKAALHRITGGFRHGMFCNTVEESFRRALQPPVLQWCAPHLLIQG